MTTDTDSVRTPAASLPSRSSGITTRAPAGARSVERRRPLRHRPLPAGVPADDHRARDLGHDRATDADSVPHRRDRRAARLRPALRPVRSRPASRGRAVLCVIASAVAVFAPNVAVLVAARLFQGLGGAAGMVIGRAVISDLSTGKAAARAFSLMMIVGGVAPRRRPAPRRLLTGPIGWRGCWPSCWGCRSPCSSPCSWWCARRTYARVETSFAPSGWHPDLPAGTPVADLPRLHGGVRLRVRGDDGVHLGLAVPVPEHARARHGRLRMLFGLNALALVVVSAMSSKLTATRSVESVLTLGIALVTTSTIAFALLVFSGAPAFWLTCRCSPPSGRWAWCSETRPPWRSAPSPRSRGAHRPCSEPCNSGLRRWCRRW